MLLSLPLSCAPEEQEGEVSDAQGCRTIILPEPVEDTSTSTSESGPRCGDGNVDPGEQCDNGLGNGEGNACNVECRYNGCGDGELGDPQAEECDDGNIDDTDACTSKCLHAYCGDGKVWVGHEECDDGADNGDDRECTSECKANVCGDGLVWTDMEECDDGADNGGAMCTASCTFNTCGDGDVYNGVEACDDGNSSNEDGCLNACETAACGDGYTQAGVEECDDGNLEPGDGCSASCIVERRAVFLSSVTWSGGSLGGLSGADSKCQSLALAAGLSGTFMAWLSSGTSGPSTRFGLNPDFNGRFQLVDGTVVAEGWADLTDGTLLHPIDETEAGDVVLWTSESAWTNTTPAGTPMSTDAGYGCSWWTSTSFNGNYGQASATDSTWTVFTSTDCSNGRRLYCFQVE